MSTSTKHLFKCDRCEASLVAEQQDEGTLPMIINCTTANCGWFMARDTGKVKAVGKTPTHKLVRNPDAKTDKLELKKWSQDNATSQD